MDLHVTNIAPTVTQMELRALIERKVAVKNITILPGGDALVSFDSGEDAFSALKEFDGFLLSGKPLSMRMALPRKERADETKSHEDKLSNNSGNRDNTT